MSNSSNRLTPSEEERLTLLIEECAEVIHAATKILRHGRMSANPTNGRVNIAALEGEIKDLKIAIQFMVDSYDIEGEDYSQRRYKEKLTYMHLQDHLK